MKLIYVAHPFSGMKENVEKVEKILRQLMREYPDYVFYSPLHATGYYYHDVPYDVGMEHLRGMGK
jgi:predicted amidohydrolase